MYIHSLVGILPINPDVTQMVFLLFSIKTLMSFIKTGLNSMRSTTLDRETELPQLSQVRFRILLLSLVLVSFPITLKCCSLPRQEPLQEMELELLILPLALTQ